MSPTTISPEGISIIFPFLLTLVLVFNCSSWSLANAFSEPYSLILDINEAKNIAIKIPIVSYQSKSRKSTTTLIPNAINNILMIGERLVLDKVIKD